jgi:thiosulfate dehydrogenase
MNKSILSLAVLLLSALGLSACGGGGNASSAGSSSSAAAPAAADSNTLPAGRYGSLVSYGRDVITDTPKYAKANVTANMSCQSCHISAGTKKDALLLAVAATFPQYNKRAHRFITLDDRIAECFLYSMNGTPPAYTSRTMAAVDAYITWLSRGRPLGAKPHIAGEIAMIPAPAAVSTANGAKIYSQHCQMCHQANGAGVTGQFPPLWGPTSFNKGAGMAKLDMMSAFVKSNMPANAPGTLTAQQAYDVAAFVLSHTRPSFNGSREIAFPAQMAKTF